MLKDCLEIFKELYEERGENLIIDSYTLDEGTYILIDENGKIEKQINVPKKNHDKTVDGYYEFCKMDYLSKLLDMNKPICSKKVIHSNNYLSFFIKKENINMNKLTENIIDNYYKVLEYPKVKYKKDKKKESIYEKLEKEIGKPNLEDIEKNKAWIKENIFNLSDEIKMGKNYLKILFKKNIEEYERESKRYILPNIYNNTDYNEIIDGIIYGLPNDNMGLNSKKPYLENKNRKKTIPYLISTEEVMFQKKFFDYLYNMACEGKYNVYISQQSTSKIEALEGSQNFEKDFTGYFLRIKKGKEVEIHDFDIISNYKNNIDNFIIQQVIPLDLDKNKKYKVVNVYEKEIKTLTEIQALVNVLFFKKFLTTNYFTEASDISLNEFIIREALLKCRNGFFNWFFKGNANAIKSVFPKASMDIIKNFMVNGYFMKAREQFNLREAILHYFKEGKSVADVLYEVNNKLREKINSKDYCSIESDEEYYFAVGQLANYLISLNKSSKKMHSLINPLINCKNNTKLKEQLFRMFKKYNYAIVRVNKRFNNLKAMVLSYVPDNKVDEQIIVAGYLYGNLIYESNKEELKNE